MSFQFLKQKLWEALSIFPQNSPQCFISLEKELSTLILQGFTTKGKLLAQNLYSSLKKQTPSQSKQIFQSFLLTAPLVPTAICFTAGVTFCSRFTAAHILPTWPFYSLSLKNFYCAVLTVSSKVIKNCAIFFLVNPSRFPLSFPTVQSIQRSTISSRNPLTSRNPAGLGFFLPSTPKYVTHKC